VIFKILIFPKNNKTKLLKENFFFFNFWDRQELTLVLRILIKDEKSGLRSSLKDICKTIEKKIWFLLEVNLTRTGLAPTYLTMENQGSCSSKKRLFVWNVDVFLFWKFYILCVFLNYLKICVTRREQVRETLKEKEKYFFCIFENQCHTVRATGQTQ